MNQAETKKFVVENGIATLRADKTRSAPEVDDLLVRLGNKNQQIPFLAVFPAGNPNRPILLDGVINSPEPVLEALRKAGPSGIAKTQKASSQTASM